MGGRGASSGFSVDKNGNPRNTYGSQYKTIFQDGNIKFVKKNQRTSETLMETVTLEPCMMCSGAIYQSRIKKIIYGVKNEKYGFTSNLKNVKIISQICEEESADL